MTDWKQVARERTTEELVRKLDAYEIVEWIHRLEDEAESREAEVEWLREAITEANEAMRDGSDSTAWAILVSALAPRDRNQ